MVKNEFCLKLYTMENKVKMFKNHQNLVMGELEFDDTEIV